MMDITHSMMKNGQWIIAVIFLLTTCVAVPVRPRRQVQDLPHIHDGIPLQDQLQSAKYDDVAPQTPVTDDTSHNAPDDASHPALPADHHRDIDGLHGDSSETGSGHGSSQTGLHDDSSYTGSGHGSSQTGLHGDSSETGSGHGSSQTGAVHDLDLNEDKTNPDSNPDSSTGGEQALVDHDLDNHQNLPGNHPVDENGELHPEVQGHSTRSSQSELRTTSVRPIHGQSSVQTTSVRQVQGQSELTPTSTNHSHGRRGLESDTEMLNRSNSQHFLLSAVDLDTERLTHLNSSTSGGQNVSVPLNTGEQILSSVHTTRPQSAMVSTTTEHVTVKAIIAHNGETEQSSHEQISDSGGGSHVAVDGVDGEQHHIATQNASAGEGHIAMLPGEHTEQGQGHEQHISEQTESDNHHSGVDIPIDKGEHPHTDHEQEPVDPVQPRHTVNPQTTPEHHEHVPVVEPPVSSTPKLVILPTPAQPEQHSSGENIEPLNPVSHEGHSGETNHEGQGHTEQGEGHPDMNGGEHENIPGHITSGEGHIEYITEEPGTESGELDKPSKDDSKTEGGKINPASGQPEILPVSESSHLVEHEAVTATISYEISNTITPSFDIGISQTGHILYSSVTAYLPPSPVITVSFYSTESLLVSRASESQPLSSIGINSNKIESEESFSSFITSTEEVIRPSSSWLSVTENIFPTPETINSQSISSSAILNPSSESLQLSASIVRPASVSSSSSPIETPALVVSPSVSVNREQSTSGPVTTSSIVPSSVSTGTESSLPSSMTPVAPDNGFLTTTDKPETIPVLTTVTTTKRKDEQNRTTILTTTKKTNTVKVSEKPENASTTFRTPVVSTFSHTTRGALPIRTTQRSDQSTPPAVYIEIELRMQWFEFCSKRPQFITEIVQIIESKETEYVSEEQLRLATENCGSVNAIMMGSGLDTITIRLYIVDIDGKIDIRLTMVASDVIYKGFQESNYFKDKILSVQYYPTRSTPLPDLRAEQRMMPPVTMVIVIAAVGGVCCVALIILQVLLHRRVKAKKKLTSFIGARASVQSMDHVALGVIPKSRPNSGYWNPGLDETMELPEPDEHSHIMNFSSLANFCMDTSRIHAEFQTIPFDNPDPTSVPVGEEDKNRFANVLPHKHTRVKLKQEENDKTDYINANYVNGYMGEKNVYIATQSPLVNTVEDFWKMVWQQQSRAILMLNPVTQQGKPKQSTCYWPDNLETDSQREYGDYVVTLKKRDIQHDYVDCTLEIMDIERNLKRELHHFWLQCWPDTGSPEPLSFVKFVLDTRPHYENTGSPVVVHCGPGTGRTGTFIAVDLCMRMFEDRRRVDILNCVHKMRSERAGAVQVKEQYTLIYQALNEYAVILSSPSISTRSSVITLHAML